MVGFLLEFGYGFLYFGGCFLETCLNRLDLELGERYWVIGMGFRMRLDALWAHKLKTNSFSAEVGDWLSPVFVAGNVVLKVRFHVVYTECFVHFLYINY